MVIRILIADDHGVLRAGLRELLSTQPDLEVVGEAADGQDARRLAETLHPDVVLMDVSMPGEGGIAATRALTALGTGVRVLLLTIHDDADIMREGLRAGAAGYILKRAVEHELMSAIRAVAGGEMYIHPAMTRALISGIERPAAADDGPYEALTPRETQVLRLVAQGHTNRQIAELLTLSVRTVESHRANLMAKLDANSRVDLVRYAASHGLLDPPVG